MNKKWIIILCIIIVVLILIAYLNFENIEKFINNKEWEIADSVATIQMEKIKQIESGKSLITLTTNSIETYLTNDEILSAIPTTATEIITNYSGDYTIVADKTQGNIYMLKNGEKLWDKKVNSSIYNICVNKNGYSAIVYYQAGYKSAIKVLKENGEELFTTFLGSTYAVDVDISADNKFLTIAEINAEGIKITSSLKIIEIEKFNEKETTNIDIGNDCMILDVAYSAKGNILILKDNGVSVVTQDLVLKDIANYDYSSVTFATIENKENIVLVRKSGTGLFGSECNVEIYSVDTKKEQEIIDTKKEYNLSAMPQNINTQNDVIALNMGNEVLFINMNGKLEKRYKLDNQLRDIKLFDNGNMSALIFRDKIELIKL